MSKSNLTKAVQVLLQDKSASEQIPKSVKDLIKSHLDKSDKKSDTNHTKPLSKRLIRPTNIAGGS